MRCSDSVDESQQQPLLPPARSEGQSEGEVEGGPLTLPPEGTGPCTLRAADRATNALDRLRQLQLARNEALAQRHAAIRAETDKKKAMLEGRR